MIFCTLYCTFYKNCFYLSKAVIIIGGSRSIGAGRIILVTAVSFNALQHKQFTVVHAQKFYIALKLNCWQITLNGKMVKQKFWICVCTK